MIKKYKSAVLILFLLILLSLIITVATLFTEKSHDILIVINFMTFGFSLVIFQQALSGNKRANEYLRLRDKIDTSNKIIKKIYIDRNSLIQQNKNASEATSNKFFSQTSKASIDADVIRPSLRDVLSIGHSPNPEKAIGRVAALAPADLDRNHKLNTLINKKVNKSKIYLVTGKTFSDHCNHNREDSEIIDLQPYSIILSEEIDSSARIIISSDAFQNGPWSTIQSTVGLRLFADLQDHVSRIRTAGGLAYYVDVYDAKDVLSEEIKAISDVIINQEFYNETDWMDHASNVMPDFIYKYFFEHSN